MMMMMMMMMMILFWWWMMHHVWQLIMNDEWRMMMMMMISVYVVWRCSMVCGRSGRDLGHDLDNDNHDGEDHNGDNHDDSVGCTCHGDRVWVVFRVCDIFKGWMREGCMEWLGNCFFWFIHWLCPIEVCCDVLLCTGSNQEAVYSFYST